MIEMDAKVQGHIEQGLLLAMVLVWQLAVFEGHRPALRKKRNLNCAFVIFGGGSIHCGCSRVLPLFF
jgi:hypothetical protein